MDIKSNKENKSCAIKFTAEENCKILGRAYLYIVFNDLHKEPFGFMEDVFVEEKNRGKGIGTKLVNEVIAEAKKQNCYKIICTSRYEKPEVHSLYKKLGFKDHGKEFRIDL
ncbi:MAG: GNAT family N-acetyltransferase [Candidatus Paceibacterota bacterium]|jgi:GNAT superfamily N-acetyltransferase